MASLLERLPNEIIRKILILAAGDVQTMLRCEQTCHVLSQLVKDDKTWEFLPGVSYWRENDEILLLNRERACIQAAVISIYDEQWRQRDNIFVRELGVDGWSSLVDTILSLFLPIDPMNLRHERFHLRGDTLFVLAELVQDNMIWFLDRAIVSEIHSLTKCLEDHYPVLTPADLHSSAAIAGDMSMNNCLFPRFEQLATEAAMGVLSENTLVRDRIVRRLSRRAGIPKMESVVYDIVWCAIVKFTFRLVLPSCWEFVDMKETDTDQELGLDQEHEKRMLHPGQTIRDISPISTRFKCTCCPDGVCFVHLLVPRQIEQAALSVVGNLRPHRVYGDRWLVPGVFETEAERDEAMDQEITNAWSMYEYMEDSDTEMGRAFEMAANNGELGAMDVDSWSVASENDTTDDDESDTVSSSVMEEDGESMN